jgi:pimeloyl-ACP methyl ester carboxylesterase
MLKSITTKIREKPVPTTVFHIPSNGAQNCPLLVFIPGNPGFVDYYTTYLTLIHDEYPHFEVLGISHAGFSSLDGPMDSIYSLEEQVDHKVQILEKFNDRPIHILGHSVGCWILQRCVERLPDHDWAFHGMLMPTVVEIHKSKKGTVLNGITSRVNGFAHFVGYLGHLVGVIPNSLTESLLQRALVGADGPSLNCTKLLVTNTGFIRQALGLAAEEMATIQDVWDYQPMWFERGNIWCVFADNDHWVSDSTRDRLIDIISEHKRVSILKTGDYTHSFCISKSKEFAKVTIEEMSPLMH